MVAILAFILFNRGCGKESVEELKEYKRMNKLLSDSLSKSQEREADAAQTAIQFRDSIEEKESIILILKSKVSSDLSTINSLANKVKALSKTVPVTDYSKACDSLADNNKALMADLEYMWSEASMYARYADSIQDAMNNQIGELNSQIDACKKTLDYGVKEVIPTVKRRLELYAGASLLGQQTKPFGGGEASLSLLNRRGQIWEVGYGNAYGNMYYRAGAKFRLSFNKH